MTDTIEVQYKGFIGQVRYDAYVGLFPVQVVNHSNLLTFQAIRMDEIEAAFSQPIDRLLDSGRLPL